MKNRLRFFDISAASAAGLIITVKCYSLLYSAAGWSRLEDFYTGVSIYNNHNKYLDIYIYFVYVLLFFILLYFIKKIRNFISALAAKTPKA